MRKTLARGTAIVGGAVALFAAFGPGLAAAVNEYKGMTYADAANTIAQYGGTAVIATKEGSFLPTNQCIVASSRTANFLNTSGTNSGSKVFLDLNCNYMFALPGVPGNSLASPEGRDARARAEQQAAEQQAQQQAAEQAAQEAAAAAQQGAGG